jgi:serine/threonine-protein kinase
MANFRRVAIFRHLSQVRSAKEVDLRSDIWALGVILYELLSGVNPFHGDSMGDTFARILSESPAPLRTLRPDVPEDLEATISQCLQRSPEKRLSSTGELASRLLPFAPLEGELSTFGPRFPPACTIQLGR